MSLKDLTAEAIATALDEFDAIGQEAFLTRYGFGRARTFFVVRRGTHYDSKAIAGAAHGHIGPGWLPLKASEFSGGDQTVASALRALGFDVQGGPVEPLEGRNPTWSRDELILALDLYMTNPASPPGKTSRAVIELSELLNRLGNQVRGSVGATFRNPAGVYMKMMNLRAHDPAVQAAGNVGLTSGGKGDELVWHEFAGNRDLLRKVADAIRKAVTNEEIEPIPFDEDEHMMEAPEGRVLTRLHRYKERNRKLIEIKKAKVFKRTGKLVCEVCEFDFSQKYGERGQGFIEAHHIKPVHSLPEEGKTREDDLALVCSNCHRMIHSSQPWLSIEELKEIVVS